MEIFLLENSILVSEFRETISKFENILWNGKTPILLLTILQHISYLVLPTDQDFPLEIGGWDIWV